MPDIKPLNGVWCIVNPKGELLIAYISYKRSNSIASFERTLTHNWKWAYRKGYRCVKVDVQYSWSNINLKQ